VIETKTNPLISLEGVAVGYGRHAILTGLNLSVIAGRITGLLGPNGSGKTTLLKTLLGILHPLAGTMRFHTSNSSPPGLGYVPQRETLDGLFLLSGYEVALMGCYGRIKPGPPMSRGEKEFVHECLRQTEADVFARKRFSELSGGQRQRVLIARALATRPELLVLDEPTAGIDAAAAHAITALLHRLNRDSGLTVLLVNHDLHTTRELVDEVIWLHQGQALCGPVAELLSPQRIEQIMELEFNA
jgi:ABC-type Mn2+/Zn2+ transport system ATPase subunit